MSRASRMAWSAESPTPRMAPSPKRIFGSSASLTLLPFLRLCGAPFAPPSAGPARGLGVDHGEIGLRLVDLGREDVDAPGAPLGDDAHHLLDLVAVGGHQRAQELDRVVGLEVRRLVGEQGIRRGVALVEAVAGEDSQQREDALGVLGLDAVLLGAADERGLLLGHLLRLLLAHGAAEQVGAAERVAGEAWAICMTCSW